MFLPIRITSDLSLCYEFCAYKLIMDLDLIHQIKGKFTIKVIYIKVQSNVEEFQKEK